MSVNPKPGYEIPVTTRQLAKAAIPKGCLAIRVRDELGELFCDSDFADLFAVRGRPTLSPARLALVSVLQFAD
jgi:transposase